MAKTKLKKFIKKAVEEKVKSLDFDAELEKVLQEDMRVNNEFIEEFDKSSQNYDNWQKHLQKYLKENENNPYINRALEQPPTKQNAMDALASLSSLYLGRDANEEILEVFQSFAAREPGILKMIMGEVEILSPFLITPWDFEAFKKMFLKRDKRKNCLLTLTFFASIALVIATRVLLYNPLPAFIMGSIAGICFLWRVFRGGALRTAKRFKKQALALDKYRREHPVAVQFDEKLHQLRIEPLKEFNRTVNPKLKACMDKRETFASAVQSFASFLPPEMQNGDACQMLLELLKTGRADTLKEAYAVFEAKQHQWQQQQEQQRTNQALLESQRRQEEYAKAQAEEARRATEEAKRQTSLLKEQASAAERAASAAEKTAASAAATERSSAKAADEAEYMRRNQ